MKINQIFKSLLIAGLAAFVVSILSACLESSSWQAMVYDKKGGVGKVIGVYASRAECEEASIMHFGKDKQKARAMMDAKGMSSSCSIHTE